MWIKICGNTNLQDAVLALEAGADALGFVFAPSPRQVTPAQVRAITSRLPARIERYGVFVNAVFDEIVSAVDQAGLSGVQLHSTGDPLLATRLREHFSARSRRLGLLQVLHLDPPGAVSAVQTTSLNSQLAELQADHSLDAILIDSRTAHAQGGTGLRFDWNAASGSIFAAAPQLRLIVAGGLTPGNVAEAIATLRPWGVDVVSGVEESPRLKDPTKLRAFISRARSAAQALTLPTPVRS